MLLFYFIIFRYLEFIIIYLKRTCSLHVYVVFSNLSTCQMNSSYRLQPAAKRYSLLEIVDVSLRNEKISQFTFILLLPEVIEACQHYLHLL